jgi:hypothetical protein
MPVCINWQCWINITGTVPYSYTPFNVTGDDNGTTELSTTTQTTVSNENLSQSNTVQDLQNEISRLKLGLGLGLGVPLLATSLSSIGLYIYFSQR